MTKEKQKQNIIIPRLLPETHFCGNPNLGVKLNNLDRITRTEKNVKSLGTFGLTIGTSSIGLPPRMAFTRLKSDWEGAFCMKQHLKVITQRYHASKLKNSQ
jgi:hypothetical protein